MKSQIARLSHLPRLRRLLKEYPVVAILGARQIGKTTLARQLAAKHRAKHTIFDLEDDRDLARLADPMLVLKDLSGLVILDEIQRTPDLFTTLRVLVDRPRNRTSFLVLGSASRALLRQSSESLAGRIVFHELDGLTLREIGAKNMDRLWARGGYPRSYLARSARTSAEWRFNFIRTFLERDIPQLGITIRSGTLRRFWTMLAHYHGQILNTSELARSFGVADTTIRNYVEILSASFMVRLLLPWTENIRKRQVRSPKIYLADSGLLHTILDLPTKRDIERHPKVGASWEGFLLGTVIQALGVRREQCYFWATHAGAELDLLVIQGRRRLGFEFKRTTAPKVTKSMRAALADLGLTRLDVIYAGKETFPLDRRIRAVGVERLMLDL